MTSILSSRASARNLSVLAYAQGFTLWGYNAGPGDTPEAAEFWQGLPDLFALGDEVHVRQILPDGTGGLRATLLVLVVESTSPEGRRGEPVGCP